jgi:hypothetical protein
MHSHFERDDAAEPGLLLPFMFCAASWLGLVGLVMLVRSFI